MKIKTTGILIEKFLEVIEKPNREFDPGTPL